MIMCDANYELELFDYKSYCHYSELVRNPQELPVSGNQSSTSISLQISSAATYKLSLLAIMILFPTLIS